MGQYMLKGYRMLDAMCPVCSAVLLQTPISEGGMKYCVGCMEVDIGRSWLFKCTSNLFCLRHDSE